VGEQLLASQVELSSMELVPICNLKKVERSFEAMEVSSGTAQKNPRNNTTVYFRVSNVI
jgi:hypothetical protein